MITDTKPKLGLALAGAVQRAVQDVLAEAGYEVYVAPDASLLPSTIASSTVDGWVFDAACNDLFSSVEGLQAFLLPAESPPCPRDSERFQHWSSGLVRQLETAVSTRQVPLVTTVPDPTAWCRVRAVWVLAGSTGATSAVQRFLNAFTKPPPIAFIYAQHYDPHRQDQLRQLTAENPLFTLEMAESRHRLAPGRILMIPPRHKVVINDFGEVATVPKGWGNTYTPNIDELFEIVAAATRLPSPGVIVFSGMGRDGAGSLDLLDAAGVRVWAQDPATAICGGMPRAAIATGKVHRSDSPEALAEVLSLLYG